MVQAFRNGRQNPVQIIHDLVVPKSQNLPALCLQESIPLFVV